MRALALAVVVAALLVPGAARAQKHDGMFKSCGQCHVASSWKTIRVGAAIDHAKTGFRLVGRHATTACVACHKGGLDIRSPWPGACVACHEDRVHRGALGRDCAGCHTALTWKLPRSRELHAKSRFLLTGAHLAADCTSCHRRADQGVYRDAPVQCIGCHRKDYERTDIDPPHAAGGLSTDCAGCHRTTAFRPARFIHAQFFPLRGQHATLACTQCHTTRFGGTPTACEGCHLDAFGRTTSPNHVTSGFPQQCGRCHAETGWKPARADWHDTIFPITRGAHAGTPCQHCHTVPNDFSVFRCTTCHTDAKTTPKHREVAGYVFDDRSCLQCHPQGNEKRVMSKKRSP